MIPPKSQVFASHCTISATTEYWSTPQHSPQDVKTQSFTHALAVRKTLRNSLKEMTGCSEIRSMNLCRAACLVMANSLLSLSILMLCFSGKG